MHYLYTLHSHLRHLDGGRLLPPRRVQQAGQGAGAGHRVIRRQGARPGPGREDTVRE